MKSIDKKCFLVNVVKRNFKFEEGDSYAGHNEGKLLKKYVAGETAILRNEIIYGEAFEDVKSKVENIVNKDMKRFSLDSIKARAEAEVKKFKEQVDNRIRDIGKEIENLKREPSPRGGWYDVLGKLNSEKNGAERLVEHYKNEISNMPFGEVNDALIEENRINQEEAKLSLENITNIIDTIEQEVSLLEKEKRDLRLELDVLNGWNGTREKEESLYESLSTIIRDDNIEDYTITYDCLKYIVVESRCADNLALQVNDHLAKGWKTLSGVQIAGAGGGETVHSWSNVLYAQSLICD